MLKFIQFNCKGLFFEGTSTTSETPILTEAQIGRLAQCSHRLIEQMPQLEPKLVQNKKKISR